MSIPYALYVLIGCITALVAPWIGAIFYYITAVGELSNLYPHHFGNSRTSLYLSLATIAGLGVATATAQIDWRRLFHTPNLVLLFLVVVSNLAVANSPFEGFEEIKVSKMSPQQMIQLFNKIMLIYFVAALVVDTRYKLTVLIWVFATILMFYVYWGNSKFIFSQWEYFGDNGRLNGPLGVYHDENYLGMMFLFATPVFYYLSVATTRKVVQYGLYVAILASWHALFLTGSRGALVGLAVVCIYIFFRSYSKKASIIMILALSVAIVDQSGSMLSRISDTTNAAEEERDRAFIENTDSDDAVEVVLNPRIVSWTVATQIIRDNLVFGIGMGNFMRAFSAYRDGEPFVAHNTLLQFGSASGLGAALLYLYLLYIRLLSVFKKPEPDQTFTNGLPRDYLDDLLNALFLGLFTSAMFLDLMVIEVLYFIFLLGYCKWALDHARTKQRRWFIDSIYGLTKKKDADVNVVDEVAVILAAQEAALDKQPPESIHVMDDDPSYDNGGVKSVYARGGPE